MEGGWGIYCNYLEVVKDEQSLAGRLGNVVGDQLNDGKRCQATILNLLGSELVLSAGRDERLAESEVSRELALLVFPSNQLPVACTDNFITTRTCR